MTYRFENTNALLESLAGSVAALAVMLHLSGVDLGVSLLLFSAALSFSVLVRLSITKKQAISILLLLLITILSIVFGLMDDSVLLFILLTANGSAVAGREISLRSFLRTGIFVSSLTALVLALSSPLNFGSRVSVGGVNPVWQSWLFAFGFVALFNTKLKWKKVRLLILGLLFLAILMTGSRQSMIAVMIAIGASLYINGFSIKYIFFGILAGIGTVAAIGARFSSSGGSRGLLEDAARLELFAVALGEINNRPSGYGFGNFQFLHWDYPHNILLELAHATGYWGLTVFLLLISYALISLKNLPQELKIAVVPVFLLSFFVAQLSGSLFSHRLLYFSLGIALGLDSSRFIDLNLRNQKLKVY
ncbi:O-antigen ligase family protein [Litoreibacter albidus]|uniref:O-antigen ligase family protein n=1 Tax=Litoreibacter albidus TaxID=670155 RepID=UPI0037369BCA